MRGNERTKVNDNILYRDYYITLFFDEEKLLAVFVAENGNTKVINIDSNFYSIEEDILAYDELIRGVTDDEEEQKEFLKAFVDYIKEEIRGTPQEINIEYLIHYGVSNEVL